MIFHIFHTFFIFFPFSYFFHNLSSRITMLAFTFTLLLPYSCKHQTVYLQQTASVVICFFPLYSFFSTFHPHSSSASLHLSFHPLSPSPSFICHSLPLKAIFPFFFSFHLSSFFTLAFLFYLPPPLPLPLYLFSIFIYPTPTSYHLSLYFLPPSSPSLPLSFPPTLPASFPPSLDTFPRFFDP